MEETPSRYTRIEMLAGGQCIDPRANAALLGRFVDLGLLDTATPGGRGKGRGKGGHWTWPEAQHQLWLRLLRERKHVKIVRRLANVTVAEWLVYGEDAVPLSQLRRALKTHAHEGRTPARANFPLLVRRLVRQIARPGAPAIARAALIDELLRAVKERDIDEQRLGKLFEEVVGPADETRDFDGPRALRLVKSKLVPRISLARATDDVLLWVRRAYWAAHAIDFVTLPYLARTGALHQMIDLHEALAESAERVVLLIGLALTAPSETGDTRR